MYIFFSSETTFKANEPFNKISKSIREKLRNFQSLRHGGLVDESKSDETYGTEFNNIGIITTILGEDLKGMWKERRLVRHKKKDADIRLEIDYDKFISVDERTQMLLYVKNIVDSIFVVENQKKGDFNGIKLINDILAKLDLTLEDIDI